MTNINALKIEDPAIAAAIELEHQRQLDKLELIASENFVSPSVREAQGSILTHKYAEGYPGKRYYGGCEFVDQVENLAINRLKEIFASSHANVQPHSGSQANMVAYFACLEPRDTVLGMDLAHGGHLTHGSPVSFSGRLFNFKSYGVERETGLINYDEVARLARAYSPKLIVAGASAYPRAIDFARFRAIADETGAFLMVDMAHIAGLVAGGVHESPVPYAHITTSTTHKTLRGPRGGVILAHGELGKKIDSQLFPGVQGGPLMHVIAGKAVAFGEALRPDFARYARQVVANAQLLADSLREAGFNLVSQGTDTHLILIDLGNRQMTGKEAEQALDAAGITVNKNTVPFDPLSPFITSGIRLGTAALTTRGFGTEEMRTVGNFIIRALENRKSPVELERIRLAVRDFARQYPLFAW